MKCLVCNCESLTLRFELICKMHQKFYYQKYSIKNKLSIHLPDKDIKLYWDILTTYSKYLNYTKEEILQIYDHFSYIEEDTFVKKSLLYLILYKINYLFNDDKTEYHWLTKLFEILNNI